MSDVKAPSPWKTYRRLLSYAGKYKDLLGLAVVGMFIEAAAAGAFAHLMEPMIDQTFVNKNPDVRWTLPAIIVGLFIFRGLATFVTDYGMARAGRSVVRDLRIALLEKMMMLPSSRFDQESVPVMVSRLNYDTEQVAQASSDAIKIILTDTLTIIFLLGVMLYHSVTVTIAIFIIAPVIAGISTLVGRRYRLINHKIQIGVGNLAHAAEEILAAQQEVKLFGRQSLESERYYGLANQHLRLNLKVEVTRASASSVVQLLAAIALAVLLIIASYAAARNQITAGGFVALMTAMMALFPSLKRIANVQNLVNKGIAASDRIFAVFDEKPEPDSGEIPLVRARGEIEFRNVTARYPGQAAAALSEVSFSARPGTVTAIVGKSGGGKSTLIRLLPRFYEFESGSILLDGLSIRDYKLADLRKQIAMVGQRVMLFDESVAFNIGYGSQDLGNVDAVFQAAEVANAMEFIDRLPYGLETRIGENGSYLSGGQRQRIAIARAVLKDAPILILDEATAALDTESERLVQQALDRLIPDRTTLIIAHRLSTIEHADQVLVIDQGRIVEMGKHADLLAAGGAYAKLHRIQFRDVEQE